MTTFIFCISVPSVIQTNNTSLLDISDGFLLQVQKEPTISVVRIRLPPSLGNKKEALQVESNFYAVDISVITCSKSLIFRHI